VRIPASLRRALAEVEDGKSFEELLPEDRVALFAEYQALWWKKANRHKAQRLQRILKRRGK